MGDGVEEEWEGTESEREREREREKEELLIKILVGAPDDQVMQRRHRWHVRLSQGDLLWGDI